jgi:two-component system sensor histidine kinase PilS (NtrC family)
MPHCACAPLYCTLRLLPVRLLDQPAASQREFLLDPVRLVRWVYVGRISIASAIFLAGIVVSQDALTDKGKLFVAAMTFTLTLSFTAGSIIYGRLHRKPLRSSFFYLQSVFDLLLVTAVVQITGASNSQFAALYILVIAAASLMLPVGGGLLIAMLGNMLYLVDAIYSVDSPFTAAVWLQLGVFAVVALGSAWLSAKLQELGAGTEAELAHVRLQAADILFNIRSGIITVDAGGRLLYANPMAEQLLGIRAEAYVGLPVLDALRPIAPELVAAVERSVRDRVRTTRAEGYIAIDERPFPIGVTTTYTDGDGRRTDRTATAIFQDISDMKRIESLRLRAERLEGVAELSASLAHEIKNPLASIRSACEQLHRLPTAGPDEQILTRLVMRESDRLSRLLSEFLDFARVRVARRESLDLLHVVEGAIHLVEAHPDRAPSVSVTVSRTAGTFLVEGDDDLLHRALFNLLLNAVQASPDGAEVRVELTEPSPEQFGVGASFVSGAVAVTIMDSGAGVPDDIRDRLFDPFFTTKPGGSGLGLAVVHRAIEAHRGLVFLDNTRSGTRFTVVLPRVIPAPTSVLPDFSLSTVLT